MSDTVKDEAVILSRDDVEEIDRILSQLNAAIKNSQLYPLDHPWLREFNVKLLEVLQEQIERRGDITLRFLENQVVFGNTPLYEVGEALSGFVRACLDRKFQSITFSDGLSMDDLTGFIGTLSMSPEELSDRGGMQEELLSRNVSHITVERLEDPEQTEEINDDLERQLAKEIYKRGFSEVSKAMEDVQLGQAITNIEGISETVNDMTHSLLRKKSALLGLTSIKNYDNYTFCHSINVGILSLSLGIYLSLPKKVLEGLGIGGLLHDIGKISIPESVLNKPGKLNNDEWAMMQRHPVNGARILRKTAGIPSYATTVAFQHHVKYDLSGYPCPVRRRSLSPYSLIIGIADCYDAMTTLRPYQKPRTPSEALRVMLELAGRDFEPTLIVRFAEMIGKYPVGSFVRLDTNEFAVVYDINPEDAERPIVKIVTDATGQRLSRAEVVELGDKDPETGHYERSIVQALNPTSIGINIADYL